MRYIDLDSVLDSSPDEVLYELKLVNYSMIALSDDDKIARASTGNAIWRPIKAYLEQASKRKCWYTESKNAGCLNDVEHFRPKGKIHKPKKEPLIHWYWFLAFNPMNYRLSCQFANRLNHNELYGKSGGKGNHFPLLNGTTHSTDLTGLAQEEPILLDPCVKSDTELLEFLPDGRPVLSPKFNHDPDAKNRVEQSKLLLNLDFPTFNEDREELYNRVKELVQDGDDNQGNAAVMRMVERDLRKLMNKDSEYSKAAECYVRGFRNKDWVEAIILSI
ncbi:hypothetical protein [Psychromonas sp. Urea-02u-13]|uniref:hypothetical protein n=1 Tax=Psychromonas sp. Urea-02u-13 TaxID=2058326 RepID=UPI000C3334FC|nr:hypothetical protein [Psychromonas sp. Urea-02u-13]PKG37108.1 hypothetical protein CXF74_20605 [Psychromonas sp. Urea-02u-13]